MKGWIAYLAAPPVAPSDIAGFIPLVTGAGGALVVLVIGMVMFMMGRIHSDPEFRQVSTRLERVETALDAEREAHRLTREALELANARADSAVRSADLIARAIIAQKKGPDA